MNKSLKESTYESVLNMGAGHIPPQTLCPLARDTMPNGCDSVSFFLLRQWAHHITLYEGHHGILFLLGTYTNPP